MTAEELITWYLSELVAARKPRRPRKRSLAQKQGARKAGRTRSQKQYAESKGFLYYHYYDYPELPEDEEPGDDLAT